MEGIEIYYKLRGETPLEALGRLRAEKPEFKDVPLSYAGRLDPIAEGLLLVLVGEANKHRQEYLGLDKEYTTDVLWGVGTDTGDVLGMPADVLWGKPDEDTLKKALPKLLGEQNQEYPAYSSKTVHGKPLWQYAREGRLGEITMPTHHVRVDELSLVKENEVHSQSIREEIQDVLCMVKGDFRQTETSEEWRKVLSGAPEMIYLSTFHIECSPGTYVRQLVNDISERVGMPACVFRLKRTRVGEWEEK